jgi:hypothetical protein
MMISRSYLIICKKKLAFQMPAAARNLPAAATYAKIYFYLVVQGFKKYHLELKLVFIVI